MFIELHFFVCYTKTRKKMKGFDKNEKNTYTRAVGSHAFKFSIPCPCI